MEEISNVSNKLPSQEIDYFKIVKILLSRWYWIVGSVAICLIGANIYLWYTPKTYSTSATMKFEEKKSELPDLAGFSTTTDRPVSRIQSETIVLQSGGLLLNAIKRLNYRFSFFVKGRVVNRTSELYPQKPLDIELIKFDSLNFFHELVTYKPVDRTHFSLSFKNGVKDVERMHAYDTPFLLGPTAVSIKNPGISRGSVYLFKLNAPEDFIGRVRGGLHTAETARNSNIIALQETDSNPQFASDALNAVMTEYLRYDRAAKMQSATQMIDFIDKQIQYLSHQVQSSEKSIEKFKQNLKILDVNTAATNALTKVEDLEKQRSLLKIQLLAIDQLKADVIKEKNNVTLNFSMEGVVDPQLQLAITKLDNLLSSRNGLVKIYNSDSQTILSINQQILDIKNTAINDINKSRTLVEKNIKYVEDQLSPLNQQISQFPVAENDMAGLKRSFDVNDKVYSFLSEKELDAKINRSGILPGATIIDLSQPNFTPVSPDVESIRRSAIIFGVVIGFGLIILIRVLNPFIYDKETIESLSTIPIIGVIRKYPEDIDEYSSQILALSKPKSVFAESVRAVRTNLNFLASDKKSKVICITSEVAGEGKSFVAVNLSSTLSLIDKRVILIAADLRRSKLHKTFQVSNDMGLSNYLANQCTPEEIILNSNLKSLDFIISGPVPPNPSELLHSARMAELVEKLKVDYDIIVIDTAPIGLVSDAIPVIRTSDINLFVIRSGKSKFYAATVPQRIAHEYHLDNTVIVLNAYEQDLLHSRYYTTKFTGDNYGGKYYYYSDYIGYESSGYYIDNEEKKWWQIWKWFN